VHPNIYLPEYRVLLKTILYVGHKFQETSVESLMMSWASYFYAYAGGKIDMMDEEAPELKEMWRKIGTIVCWKA